MSRVGAAWGVGIMLVLTWDLPPTAVGFHVTENEGLGRIPVGSEVPWVRNPLRTVVRVSSRGWCCCHDSIQPQT